MSADNGIYIHKFKNGWAVAYAQAIENIYWAKGNKKYNYNELYRVFENAPRFKTKVKALLYASKEYEKLDICEYGISII